MGERKRRKKNSLRGQRSHGKGDTKNHRGAGSRGGRGNAGANKHKWNSLNRFKERKIILKAKKKEEIISIEKLDITAETYSKEKGYYIVTPKKGAMKVVGQGSTDKKFDLRIPATKTASEKIIAAGGKTQEVEIEKNEE